MVSVVEQFADSPDISADAVFAEQPDGRIQPLSGLFRAHRCLPLIRKMIEDDNWRLQDLTTQLNTRILRFAEYEDLPGADHFF